MDRATISLFLVYGSLSLTDGRKKKNVGGRDPISRRAGCGTGSGWTVAQLLERGRAAARYRYETRVRRHERGRPTPNQIAQFREFRKVVPRIHAPDLRQRPGDVSLLPPLTFLLSLLYYSPNFHRKNFTISNFKFLFFFQVDRIENDRSNRKRREEIAKALSTSIVVVSIYYSPSLCRVSIERIL